MSPSEGPNPFAMYGPELTFLGVPRADLADPASLAAADVVVVGAPFDGGTSNRPGARFGPSAIRGTDYLAHDGSRPSLALGVDALQDLRVVDAGDVLMLSGEIQPALERLRWVVVQRDLLGDQDRQLLDRLQADPAWRTAFDRQEVVVLERREPVP